jgi:8-oxo-dGTP pyrophosphatase MutT (NUDIX family)
VGARAADAGPAQGKLSVNSELPIRRYASAGGVVVDAVGERVLVLLRPGRPGPDGRPEVRLPKGHIEPGESRRTAALREVGEEAGLPHLEGAAGLEIVSDLGHQIVEFDWKGHHYIRDESCFLMTLSAEARLGQPERQFKRLWLTWEDALARLTFGAEREWVRRAQSTHARQLENVSD